MPPAPLNENDVAVSVTPFVVIVLVPDVAEKVTVPPEAFMAAPVGIVRFPYSVKLNNRIGLVRPVVSTLRNPPLNVIVSVAAVLNVTPGTVLDVKSTDFASLAIQPTVRVPVAPAYEQ